MKTLFEHTSASWVRYSDYEWKEADGQLYLLPTADAKPLPYDPMKDAETLVISAGSSRLPSRISLKRAWNLSGMRRTGR